MAKQQEEGEDSALKSNKIIMTEVMGLLLKQHKDQQMVKAYTDCFLFLTKQFNQPTANPKLTKFLVFTYKELLKTFLSGRTSSSAINLKFFQMAFEQNPSLGWNFVKMLLKCILSLKNKAEAGSRKNSTATVDGQTESAKKSKAKAKTEDKEDEEGDGSRSNHQRLQAVELFGFLIKESQHSEQAKKAL